MMKKSFVALLFVVSVAWSCVAGACQNGAGDMPIQHRGRIKPFVAFAQETLQSISGKKYWHGQDAITLFLKNLDQAQKFLKIPFIRVDHPALKTMLGLSKDVNYFSYEQIKPSINTLTVLIQNAGQKREKDVRPSALEQQAEVLYQRLRTVNALSTGALITVIPGSPNVAWASPYALTTAEAVAFKKMIVDYRTQAPAFKREMEQWLSQSRRQLPRGQVVRVKMESLYYAFQPFYYAGILYLLGFLCLLLSNALVRNVGKFLLLTGFIFHTGGILLRGFILLRPPVANMYETMVFMDWVLMFSVGIFVLLQKRYFVLSSGAIVSAMVMFYANLLPVDQSLDVLAPVLRSSYWLTIHVIVIVSSYSMFAFAMAVSHRHLFLASASKMTPQEDQASALVIYRLLQAGLIALGVGTVMGGVWANEAWGRFWGWDPKETWAFITFLGYMTILHLRYSKKLNNFALAVGSVLGFLLVLMTWYGVNFVLGRGLHSYGAGSGGLNWIIGFLVFEVGFLVFVAMNKKGS